MAQTRPEATETRRTDGMPRLSVLFDELLWPKLFRSWTLALRPASLGVALVVLLLIALVGEVPEFFYDSPEPGAEAREGFVGAFGDREVKGAAQLGAAIMALDPGMIVDAIWEMVIGTPLKLLVEYTWETLLLGPVLLAIWVLGGGTISRMAACDFSGGILVPWPEAMRQARSRWLSLIGAVIGPMLLVAALGLVIAGASAVFFHVPVLNVVGGALYVLALGLALLAVVVLVGYALGGGLLVPAVVCEGTDGIDAIQRAYAYAYGNPLRVALYGLIVVVQGLIAYLVLAFIADRVMKFGVGAATVFLSPGAEMAVRGPEGAEALGGSAATAHRLVEFWNKVPGLFVAAYVVSYLFSAASVMYLLLRQVNDGQDIGELWMPGVAEGAMRDTIRARGEAARAAGVPQVEKMEDEGAEDE